MVRSNDCGVEARRLLGASFPTIFHTIFKVQTAKFIASQNGKVLLVLVQVQVTSIYHLFPLNVCSSSAGAYSVSLLCHIGGRLRFCFCFLCRFVTFN